MNITQNPVDNLNATLKVEVNKEDYAGQIEKTLKDYQKKAVIDGFRKGKVPYGIIKKMYGKAVLIDEINKLLGESLTNYINENDLKILGEPLPNETEQQELDFDGDNFEFIYDIAFAPEMNVKVSKREKIPYYRIIVDEETIDKQIESILQSNGELKGVDVVEGTEYLKGEIFELDSEGKEKTGGIRNDDSSLSVLHIKDESSKEAFVGAKEGSQIVFNPAKAFPNKSDLAGMLGVSKEVAEDIDSDFCFIIRDIKRYIDAEVGQELFNKMFGEGVVNSIEEFRQKVKEDLEQQFVSHSDYRFSVDARDKMIKKNEAVDLPETFLKRWIVATNENLTPEAVEKDFLSYRDEFKWQLIKSDLIKESKIEVTEDDFKKIARGIAAAQLQQYGLHGLSDEQLDSFATRLLEDKKQRSSMYERAIEEKIFAVIKEQVKLDEQEISMEDFGKLFEK